MKNSLRRLTVLFAVIAVLSSCEKDENRITLESGKQPVLTATQLSGYTNRLMMADSTKPFMRLSWTNPDYRFTTGVSSQNVNYVLQIDTTGSNFTSPEKNEVSVTGSLDSNFNVKAFNSLLAKTLEDIPHNIEIRIKASLGASSAAPIYSNVIKLTLTPYLDAVVTPPTTGRLYITGSATPAGWMGGGDPELASQRFTRVNSTIYEITLPLSAGNSFLLIPAYGDWSSKYGFTGANNQNNANGDSFKKDGGDLKSPAQAGTYKITVNFKTGVYTALKQ